VGIGKQQAALREPVNMRGMHPAFIPTQAVDPVLHIVYSQKEDIGSLRWRLNASTGQP